jgi:predicted SAM-dependent methyltransferase
MDFSSLVRSADGSVNLHIWRDGEEYLKQKGGVFLNQWNNVIFSARPGRPLPNTRYVDLSAAPLPFPDATFDAVYAYHIFEHLTPLHGERCARQIFKLLKPGGIWRISVPDLESACRDYLRMLDTAAHEPTPRNVLRYRWAVMVIFEQMVRDRSGGQMLEAIKRGEYDAAQMQEMFGDALRSIIERSAAAEANDARAGSRHRGRSFFRSVLRSLYRAAQRAAGKKFPPAADYGRMDPRETKEAVQWMYDRLSLRLLLEHAGFEAVRQVDHASSSIPRWSQYDFDRANHGDYPFDPSVYFEGCKPAPGR